MADESQVTDADLYSQATREFLQKLKTDYNLYEQFTIRERRRSFKALVVIMLFASVFTGFGIYQTHKLSLTEQELTEVHNAVVQTQRSSVDSKTAAQRFNALVHNQQALCKYFHISDCQ